VDEILGAACEVRQPVLHVPAGAAARRTVKSHGGQERRILPWALRQAFDNLFAGTVERHHLDAARFRIRIVDPKPRLLGRGDPRAFALHQMSSASWSGYARAGNLSEPDLLGSAY